MRKLIEETELSFIVCDNPECDYELKPENIELIDFINKWFSWVTIFYSKKKLNKRVALFVHVHNGVKIEL